MRNNFVAADYKQRRATVGKRGDEWVTICHGGAFLNPMILPWTNWETALRQALIWVGLLKWQSNPPPS